MIGDVLASSIVCNNIKALFPEAKVDYLIYPFTAAVIENNPNIDEVLLFKEEFRSSKKAFFNFLLSIRKRKYDIVIDAYGKLESNLIVALSGADKKIGFYKKYTQFIYSKTIHEIAAPLTPAGTALENRMNLLTPLLQNSNITLDPKPKIFLTAAEIENGKRLLQQYEIEPSKKIFMIGVLGSEFRKTYPFPFMATILDAIVQETDATLLFNYMKSQQQDAQNIFDLCAPATQKNIKIKLVPGSIREFLSITHHCNALIGNEGGAVNMAKALNVPTFTLFSTWIIKEAWNSFENGTTNVSVHLKDFKPELYGEKTAKEMKAVALDLYQKYTPDLFVLKVKQFVREN